MIRVLHALGTLNPGGVETWLMNVLRHVDRTRVQMDFCTFGTGKGVFAAEAESLGSTVHSCAIEKGAHSLGQRFREIVREGKYGVVHSHVHHFSGVLLRWAEAEGVPRRIAHSHSAQDGKRTTFPRRLYRGVMVALIRRHATHCLAASRQAAAGLFGPQWESDNKIRVLHYGVDLRPFEQPVDPNEVRGEFGLPLGVPVVGHVGRFVEPKNHTFLIEIAREVIGRRPDCHFLLVGDGPLRPTVEAQTKALGLCKNIHFTGTRHDVPRLLRGAMDAFVMPSLWEGLPVGLIEAQAAGLPCVVSDRVTTEVALLAERVAFASITTGPELWSDILLGLLMKTAVQREGCLERVSKSDFAIESSVRRLEEVYGSRP